jgi:hypothetical protein
LRSLRFRLNNQLGFRTVINNMREGFVCSLCFFKCWVPCGTDNQLVQTTNVEMGWGSSLKIIRGLQVCICFDSLPFLLMHLLGSNNQLSWKCHRHVATCRRRHNVSLQFWPSGSVSPTQNLRCRGSLCRLLPTFSRFSEVYNILRTFVPGPKHPLANKLFDIFGVNHGIAALKLKEIQQSKRVDMTEADI